MGTRAEGVRIPRVRWKLGLVSTLPPPGRISAAARSHSFAELATASDDAPNRRGGCRRALPRSVR